MEDTTKTPPAAPYLSRSEILSKTRLRAEDVEVPEWGGTVRVRELTGTERDEFEGAIVQMKVGGGADLSMENARARLVSMSAIQPDGARLFTEADVTALGRLSAAALSRVFDVAARLSKISNEDIEELAKN